MPTPPKKSKRALKRELKRRAERQRKTPKLKPRRERTADELKLDEAFARGMYGFLLGFASAYITADQARAIVTPKALKPAPPPPTK